MTKRRKTSVHGHKGKDDETIRQHTCHFGVLFRQLGGNGALVVPRRPSTGPAAAEAAPPARAATPYAMAAQEHVDERVEHEVERDAHVRHPEEGPLLVLRVR